ncbi:5-bromo-4-chloroindolyl phosphate hydrolysis family protein [Roseovarius tibetensis]|uniref:5-bromo-4-chloroindolyl phosphate hydrolysis family protein n=1 Tax=Roseovarius tibetensis TaxID=2685897 RepID=UPI003D7F923F
MARRYGGQYSPDTDGTAHPPQTGGYRGARRTRVGGRVNLLFFVPLPLAVRAFTSGPVDLALNLAALGLLLLGAWLTREGLRAEEAYDARRIARRPPVPRKILATLCTGAGLGLAGAAAGGLLAPVIFAVAGAGLHVLAFGIDPLHDKHAGDIDSFQSSRVARVVDQAEDYLAAMSTAIRRVGDRALEARLEQFQVTVRDMLRTVENDPRDLTAARKYLGVYLMGARDAAVKYADLATRAPNPEARDKFLVLLSDLERNFTAKTRALMADSSTDLDIEIEVLRERLEREGVHLETPDPA